MSRAPIVRAPGEGERRWFFGGGLHTWKVRAEDTGGAFFVFEDVLARGKMTPLHCHPDADEVVYVVEGEILVRAGDEERRIGSGGTLVMPRGVPHAFIVTSEVARLFYMQTPGGGESFYRDASEPAPGEGDASGPVDFGRVRDAAKATGSTEILGPPPFAKPA
jgi:quercetin dioxygenase-like cupin family protein